MQNDRFSTPPAPAISFPWAHHKQPLGTPQTVGKRQTPDGTDYKFTVASRGMNGGGETTSIIYVTVGKDTKPEFTEVVR